MQKLITAAKKAGRAIFPRKVPAPTVDELLKRQTDAKAAQLILQQNYRALLRAPERPLPGFAEVGLRQYSQYDEDGILLYLFALIPPANRTCLEICAGDGLECNTANLLINHGWWGHLFDGGAANVQRGREFYGRHPDTALHPPNFTCAWITAENVNSLVRDSGLGGKIDLFSLDLDGNDYWIWKALDAVDPTVVVCEVMNHVPPDLALTMPYNAKFTVTDYEDYFRGASLQAMVNLGREKGYRLVGTHRYGFNAFFVKRGVAEDLLPEKSAAECADDPYSRNAREKRWPQCKDRPWVTV